MTSTRRSGMTLIEVMVAGAIFAVGASAVLGAVASYMQVVAHQRRLGEAWRVLQADVTHLRALPDTHALWTASSTANVDALGLPAVTASDVVFRIERTPRADAPIVGAREVQIVLRWQERTQPRDVTLVVHR